jgi:hypothetical protein
MRPAVDELKPVTWQTSIRSQQQGACVAVAVIDVDHP